MRLHLPPVAQPHKFYKDSGNNKVLEARDAVAECLISGTVLETEDPRLVDTIMMMAGQFCLAGVSKAYKGEWWGGAK